MKKDVDVKIMSLFYLTRSNNQPINLLLWIFRDPKICSGQLAGLVHHGGYHGGAPLPVMMLHSWPNGHGDEPLLKSFGEEVLVLAACLAAVTILWFSLCLT